MQIVEFSDFQCPFCRTSYRVLKELRRTRGTDFALTYRHLPLQEVHPQAFNAAVAAECAAGQDRFASFHDELFEQPNLVRASEWLSLAEKAGIRDLDRFGSCLQQDRAADRVRRDLAVADSLGLVATPTFIVNGRVVTGTQTLDEWVRILDDLSSEIR